MTITYGKGFMPELPTFANMGVLAMDVTPLKIVKMLVELRFKW